MLDKTAETSSLPASEDQIQEMLILAQRLKAAHGDNLDDEAIRAVAEATGAPEDYVRLALRSVPTQEKSTLVGRIRTMLLGIDPDIRSYVIGAALGALGGKMSYLAFASRFSLAAGPGLFDTLAILAVIGGLWTAGRARESRVAAGTGLAVAVGWFVTNAVFAFLHSLVSSAAARPEAALLIPFAILGALAGLISHAIISTSQRNREIRNQEFTRSELIEELARMRDRRLAEIARQSGQAVTAPLMGASVGAPATVRMDGSAIGPMAASAQALTLSSTFLSIEVVGMNVLRTTTDANALNETLGHLDDYLKKALEKHGGRLHSQLGDAHLCAFGSPADAFAASRQIQSGLFELNQYRNKIAVPIQLRQALHTFTSASRERYSTDSADAIERVQALQRTAPPGTVVVSGPAAEVLPGGAAAVGYETVAAGESVGHVWRPKSTTIGSRPGS